MLLFIIIICAWLQVRYYHVKKITYLIFKKSSANGLYHTVHGNKVVDCPQLLLVSAAEQVRTVWNRGDKNIKWMSRDCSYFDAVFNVVLYKMLCNRCAFMTFFVFFFILNQTKFAPLHFFLISFNFFKLIFILCIWSFRLKFYVHKGKSKLKYTNTYILPCQ